MRHSNLTETGGYFAESEDGNAVESWVSYAADGKLASDICRLLGIDNKDTMVRVKTEEDSYNRYGCDTWATQTSVKIKCEGKTLLFTSLPDLFGRLTALRPGVSGPQAKRPSLQHRLPARPWRGRLGKEDLLSHN